MSRTINRSVARQHYTKFSKLWRDDLRTAGLYGKPGSPRRPTFNQWYGMHMQDITQTKQSTPKDVAEFLQPGIDPWMESGPAGVEVEEERGVVTMQMVGGEDDE